MSAPTTLPTWASNANYVGGPAIGTPTCVAPLTGDYQEGFEPGQEPSAQKFNFLLQLITLWINYLASLQVQTVQIYGYAFLPFTVTANPGANEIPSPGFMQAQGTFGIPAGRTIVGARFYCRDVSGSVIAMSIGRFIPSTGPGASVTLGASSGAGTIQTIASSIISCPIVSGTMYVLDASVTPYAAATEIFMVELDHVPS